MKKSCEIENALIVLREAIDKKKAEMQNARPQATGSAVMVNLLPELLTRAQGSYVRMENVLQQAGGFVQSFFKKIQQDVQERPWEAVRKAAVSSFAVGFMLSFHHKKQGSGEKT